MSLQVTKHADVVVIEVDGQLIVGNRQELKQKVLDEAEAGARKVLIDFAKAGYIDSSGLGVLVSLAVARWMAALLFETRPTDVAALSGGALVLVVAALLASLVPVRRAVRTDPQVTLRGE